MELAFIKSPIGNLKIISKYNEIFSIEFTNEYQNMKIYNKTLQICINELNLYFNGKLKIFDTKFSISGSLFEQKVYNALLKIPYGTTTTYKDIAIEIGHPKAARAVGNANSKNKIPIIIPCHRVVGLSSLGGYSGGNGVETKKFLLDFEQFNKNSF